MNAFTLFNLAGRTLARPPLPGSVLLLIDFQNEYLAGPLALPDAKAAVARAGELLEAGRAAGAKVVHVAHKGAAGGLFDRAAPRGAIVDALAPKAGEIVVEKPRPNAFSGTDLAARVGEKQRVIIAGFMTHNCVSSTARAAFDLGHDITIAADACATRDLPSPDGPIDAATIHAATLAALADRHGLVADVATLVSPRA